MSDPRRLAWWPGPRVVGGAGVELGTVVRGGEGAPVALVLHGVGSSRDYLAEAVAPPLLAAGWRVVLADLRGHGASTPLPDPADHVLDRQVADVVALAAVFRAEALVGVSLGGHAAVAAVARGLVPSCTGVVAALPAWIGRAVPGEGPHAAVAAEVRTHGVEGMVRRLRDSDGLRPWLRRTLLRDLVSHHPASLAAALQSLDGGLAPTSRELGSLSVPLGVVGWPDDPGHPLEVARAWVDVAPRARLETLTLDDPDLDTTALGTAVLLAMRPDGAGDGPASG